MMSTHTPMPRRKIQELELTPTATDPLMVCKVDAVGVTEKVKPRALRTGSETPALGHRMSPDMHARKQHELDHKHGHASESDLSHILPTRLRSTRTISRSCSIRCAHTSANGLFVGSRDLLIFRDS